MVVPPADRAQAAAQMLLSAGTTIGRTPPTKPLPGPLLRCCFPQVRPSVVPPADCCPGRCSDAAFLRCDHRSYPRQTSARAAAQMPLSAGTTDGRTCFYSPHRKEFYYDNPHWKMGK